MSFIAKIIIFLLSFFERFFRLSGVKQNRISGLPIENGMPRASSFSLPGDLKTRGKVGHVDNRELIEINDEIRYSEVEIIGAELREAMESMKAIIKSQLISQRY
jgi:hypothetical protein